MSYPDRYGSSRLDAGGGSVVVNSDGTVSIVGDTDITGDLAVTLTSTLTGNVAIGGSIAASGGLNLRSTALTGTTQVGAFFYPIGTSGGTSNIRAIECKAATAAASYTCTSAIAIQVQTIAIGAGSTVTNQYGMRIAALSGAGTNYAIFTDGAGLVKFGDMVLINDTVNANMTTGLTINQGATDDEVLAFKSSDVAHVGTDITEADTFATFKKSSATGGGLQIIGFSDTESTTGNSSLELAGFTEDTALDTDKTTSALAAVVVRAGIISSNTYTTPGADENLVVFRAFDTTRFIFDQEGTAHADDVWTDSVF